MKFDICHKVLTLLFTFFGLVLTGIGVWVAYDVLVVQVETNERSKKDLELKITTVKEQGEKLDVHQKALDRAIAELNQAKTRLQEQQIQLTQTIEITRLQQERLNANVKTHVNNLNLFIDMNEIFAKGLLISDQLSSMNLMVPVVSLNQIAQLQRKLPNLTPNEIGLLGVISDVMATQNQILTTSIRCKNDLHQQWDKLRTSFDDEKKTMKHDPKRDVELKAKYHEQSQSLVAAYLSNMEKELSPLNTRLAKLKTLQDSYISKIK